MPITAEEAPKKGQPQGLPPSLVGLFEAAESRHFTDDELAQILEAMPDAEERVATAKAVRDAAGAVVKAVVDEMHDRYPYLEERDYGKTKCVRDGSYVIAYATDAMLAQDKAWFEDKLLLWMRTILQAFDYGGDRTGYEPPRQDDQLEATLEKLPEKCKSIYAMYYGLNREMREQIAPEHYEQIGPYLTLATDCLSEDVTL